MNAIELICDADVTKGLHEYVEDLRRVDCPIPGRLVVSLREIHLPESTERYFGERADLTQALANLAALYDEEGAPSHLYRLAEAVGQFQDIRLMRAALAALLRVGAIEIAADDAEQAARSVYAGASATGAR